MKAGVRLYYGLYFVEEAVDQCSQRDGDAESDVDLRVVRLAGKGGLVSVVCRCVEWRPEETDLEGRLSLRAWMRDARDENF